MLATSQTTIANPSAQITLLLTGMDSVEEGVEVVEIAITPSSMSYTVGTPSKATVFITEAVVVAPPSSASLPTGKLYRVCR